MSLQLIGISGKAGSGKDYVANTVLEPLGFQRWSLAWHFKIWAVGQGLATYDEVFNTKPPEVRKMLQEMGTEQGRNVYGENIWCDTAAAWIQLLREMWGQGLIVIPDIRFPNEVEMVQRLGGKVLRIQAARRVETSSLSEEARKHASETALDGYDPFDGYILNDFDEPVRLDRQFEALFSRFGWRELAQQMANRSLFRFGGIVA